MTYNETSEETLEDTKTSIPEDKIEPEVAPKVIQLLLEDPNHPPIINYTENVSISEVVGALALALETLKTIHVQDKLKKKRLLAAYNDV